MRSVDRIALKMKMTIQELHSPKYRKLIRVNCHLNIYRVKILIYQSIFYM